jgi:NDP-mannose synthase
MKTKKTKKITAVIMAGGKGTRLQPYTLVLPKPLMPVGGQPVIEILLMWLRRSGIEKCYISTGYLGHLIRILCGDGSQWGMDIAYSLEPHPLGTIGALRLLKDNLDSTFVVLNGDLITDLDLGQFIRFHKKQGGNITVAITKKDHKMDLGVISHANNRITEFKEKPTISHDVSMGVYCLEPAVLDMIPDNVPFGFDSLMNEALIWDMPVYTYRHDGLWMDIGREEDFLLAQQNFMREHKELVLGA